MFQLYSQKAASDNTKECNKIIWKILERNFYTDEM